MGPLLFYIFQAGFSLAVFYFCFRLFFRRDTLFRTNRFILLGGSLVCMLLPFVELDGVGSGLWQQPVSVVRSMLADEGRLGVLTGMDSGGQQGAVSDTTVFPSRQTAEKEFRPVSPSRHSYWIGMLGAVYLIGATGVFLFFLVSTWRMFRLISHQPQCGCGKYRLVVCPEEMASFSWGNFIVLSQEDYDSCADEVLLHEQMHLRYRHTWDLLWMEMLLVLHWFNPAAWLLMRDLRELHEFEADNGVLKYGIDATQYQLLLVKRTVGTRLYSMANGFNHSKLKNRINMMLKKRTNGWARLKLLLFVPVAAGTLMAFARPEVKETVAQMVKPECTTTGTGVQDSLDYDEWELLEQYFQRKTEESYPGKTADSWEWESSWQFFINYKDQLMLGDDKVQDTEQLRSRWADVLRKRYREALEKKDRAKLPKLCVRYDRGSTVYAVRSSLRAIKEAYEQVHAEIRAQYGDAAPDSLLPIAVYKKVPRIYKNQTKYRTPSDVPLPIEVTFLRSDGKQLSETMKNLTLDELTQAVIRYKGKSQNMTISIKADDKAKMSVVNDAKEIIREVYSE